MHRLIAVARLKGQAFHAIGDRGANGALSVQESAADGTENHQREDLDPIRRTIEAGHLRTASATPAAHTAMISGMSSVAFANRKPAIRSNIAAHLGPVAARVSVKLLRYMSEIPNELDFPDHVVLRFIWSLVHH